MDVNEKYDELMKEVDNRGEFIAPLLSGASWINLKGNFTANELRIIANKIDEEFAKILK